MAVRNVLEGGGLCHPMIIFGPAGTGKTRTLVELIRLLLVVSTSTILVAAPSNAAADVVTRRLEDLGFDRSQICRWNALRRIDANIEPKVAEFSNDDTVKSVRCVITTCLASNSIPRRNFDFLLIDEAGQATEPDILIPMKQASGAQVILGNHRSNYFMTFIVALISIYIFNLKLVILSSLGQ